MKRGTDVREPFKGLSSQLRSVSLAERSTVNGAENVTHAQGKAGSTNTTIASPVQNDLLRFLQTYQASRDAEVAKINEELKKSKQRIIRTQNIPPEITNHVRSLPIYAKKTELLNLIRNHQIVIVVAETGSGKSTQIPQYIADSDIVKDGRMIGITQPRRVAAKSLAERVALESGVKLGTAVGFVVRFESCVSSKTVIKYMTDGILVKEFTQGEATGEANLDSYSVIIIDEAHERRTHTDVCFGLLKRVAKKRPDLKIIISSATLETTKFSTFFDSAPVFSIEGKKYDVEVIYEPCSTDYMTVIRSTIMRLHDEKIGGDILVFLTGEDEIEKISDELEQHSSRKSPSGLELIVVPCYGLLPFEEQQKIFYRTPKGFRKVVLATNIAETSVTIDGVVFVIDCGYVKEKRFNYTTKIESLVKIPITKFQAIQRRGRAGRTQPGKCYRLYSHETYERFRDAPQPSIQRSNVESVVLDLLAMGIPNPLNFEFIDAPPEEAIGEALLSLKELSALDNRLCITALGREIAAYPLDPPLAKVLIVSANLGCAKDVLKIVSLLSTQHQRLFSRDKRYSSAIKDVKRRFHAVEGDHLSFLRIYDEFIRNDRSEEWCTENFIQFRYLEEAEEIKSQLQDIMIKYKLLTKAGEDKSACRPDQRQENICKSFTSGYFFQLAKKRTMYAFQKLTSSGEIKDVFMHPSSSLFPRKPLPEWVIFHEVMETSKAYMIGAVEIQPQWIREFAPNFFNRMKAKYPLPFAGL